MLRDTPFTLVFYESPKRVSRYVKQLARCSGRRPAGGGLPRADQKVRRNQRAARWMNLCAVFDGRAVKGELVVLVGREGAQGRGRVGCDRSIARGDENNARERCGHDGRGRDGPAAPAGLSNGLGPWRRRLTGQTGYHAGRVAEDIVARDYSDRDHTSAATPLARARAVKLILILRNGAQVVFVEVKKSASLPVLQPGLGANKWTG